MFFMKIVGIELLQPTGKHSRNTNLVVPTRYIIVSHTSFNLELGTQRWGTEIASGDSVMPNSETIVFYD